MAGIVAKWTESRVAELVRHKESGKTWAEIADAMDESISSCRGAYCNRKTKPSTPRPQREEPAFLPEPCAEAGGAKMPEPWTISRTPLVIQGPAKCLVLGDTHVPMHDKATILAAVAEAKSRGVDTVLLNGDIADMFGVTPFYRPFTRQTFADEIGVVDQLLTYLRAQLPKARFIYREGNHEFRLKRYIADNAARLQDLPSLFWENLIDLPGKGIEWVADKRKVELGKLITLHGHEFRKGEGINPARLAFLRATATVLVGHHHRSSEHPQRTLDGRLLCCWSVGCACYISPEYDPYNQWNHGYAIVEVDADGWFHVHNRKVIDGRTA